MVGPQHADVLRSLGLVSRPSRRHVTLPLSWNALLKYGRGRDIAMLLTLLGAGSMGAVLAIQYASGASLPITLPWSANSTKRASSDQKRKAHQDLTVPGLQNMGNNCFLNVVLQALASSEILVSFMEECARVINRQEVQAERVMMPLAVAVADLLKELAQGQIAHRTLSPRRVMLALALYAQQFDLAMQQDAAEALAHLAAGLQEERDDYLQLHRPVSQSFGTVLGKHSPPPQLHQSWLHWPLEGTLGSLMACQRCGFQFSTQFQFFNDIPLPPLRQADGSIIEDCTLEDCLDQFTAPEWVASVKCSHCAHMAASQVFRTQMGSSKVTTSQHQSLIDATEGTISIVEKCSCDDDCACEALTLEQGGVWNPVHTNASKRLRIGRSPEVLCLQVQRAVMDGVGELRKLMGHVAFPMVLDLFPYTIAAQEGKLRSTDTRTETHSDSLIQMLRQRGVMLSHIRKLQGTGYPSSLFSPELGIKGGSELSKEGADDVETNLEPTKATGVIADVTTSVASEEDPVLGDSGANQLINNEMPKFVTKQLEESGNSTDTVKLESDGSSTPKKDSLRFSSSGRTDLGALADPHGTSTSSTQSGSHPLDSEQATAEKVLHPRKLLYELLSVVVHHGGAQSGHYTVYRKVRVPKAGTQEAAVESPTFVSGEAWKERGPEPIIEKDCSVVDSSSEVQDQVNELESDGKAIAEFSSGLQTAKGRESGEDVDEEKAKGRETEVVWFRVSDSNVRRVEEPEVRLANASLLFYERSRSNI